MFGQIFLIVEFVGIILLLTFLISSVLFGAPYVPTLDKTSKQLFATMKLYRGDLFYDLGCGDGKVLRAARQHGYQVVGYETNPLLYLLCRWRFRGDRQAKIKFGNFIKADLSDADLIYVFGVRSIAQKLEQTTIKTIKRGAWLVMCGYRLPKRKPIKSQGVLIYYKF
jgi:SAM-dependent methyltransferase